MEFSWQESWSGLPFPSPVDLPNSGTEPWSPTLQADSLPCEPQGRHSLKDIIYTDENRKFHKLQFSSVTQSCPTLYNPMPALYQASLSFTISWSLLTFMSIELVMLSNPSHPLPPSSPFAFSLCQHQYFSMTQLFASAGQSTGASASSSILPMNIQD